MTEGGRDDVHTRSRLHRRDLLRLGGAAGALALAAACDTSSPSSTAPSGSASTGAGSPTATTSPSPTRSASAAPSTSAAPSPTPTPRHTRASAADWTALGRGLAGTLVRPDDADYAQASRLFNPRFDHVRPQGIVQCARPQDVAEAVGFASRHGLPLAMRSGGHCYAGWSVGPGLVVDVGPMHEVALDGGTARVGAGAPLIDVYSTLNARGVGIPGGSCPTVGITGLTLGGGIGVVDRAWGLTCDSLTGLDIVTADGRVRTCDARHEPDLFWACRGGGGGTFGVVTGLRFRTRRTEPVTTWYLSWPWSAAQAVLSGWLQWLPTAPDALWGSVHLSSAPTSAGPVLSVVGTYLGDSAGLNPALDAFISAVGTGPTSRSTHAHSFADTMLIEAGCGDTTAQQCRLAPAGQVHRQAYAASSDFITRPMSGSGIGTLLSAVQRRHDAGAPDVAVQLDACGGAINRVHPGATAFVHRDAICSVQYIANWYDSTPPAAVRSAADWPGATRKAMRPYVSGQAYQNYVDPSIGNWKRAYFGANYRRLSRIKARYDPHEVFHHPQSVRPA